MKNNSLIKMMAATIAAGMLFGCAKKGVFKEAYPTPTAVFQEQKTESQEQKIVSQEQTMSPVECISNRVSDKDKVSYNLESITQIEYDLSKFQTNTPIMQVNYFGEYLNFRKTYQDSITEIIEAIQNKKFAEVESKIRTLAKELDAHDNPHVKAQLQKVTKFHYFIYEASDNIYKDKQWTTILWTTVFKKVKINPYNGEREVIKEDVPYERLKQEIESDQKE
jgi:hypothetical protein